MDDKRVANSRIVWIAVVLAFAVLYFLSVGPAVVLRESGVIPGPIFFIAYGPVALLYNTVPFVAPAIDRYADLWLAGGRMIGIEFPNVPNP